MARSKDRSQNVKSPKSDPKKKNKKSRNDNERKSELEQSFTTNSQMEQPLTPSVITRDDSDVHFGESEKNNENKYSKNDSEIGNDKLRKDSNSEEQKNESSILKDKNKEEEIKDSSKEASSEESKKGEASSEESKKGEASSEESKKGEASSEEFRKGQDCSGAVSKSKSSDCIGTRNLVDNCKENLDITEESLNRINIQKRLLDLFVAAMECVEKMKSPIQDEYSISRKTSYLDELTDREKKDFEKKCQENPRFTGSEGLSSVLREKLIKEILKNRKNIESLNYQEKEETPRSENNKERMRVTIENLDKGTELSTAESRDQETLTNNAAKDFDESFNTAAHKLFIGMNILKEAYIRTIHTCCYGNLGEISNILAKHYFRTKDKYQKITGNAEKGEKFTPNKCCQKPVSSSKFYNRNSSDGIPNIPHFLPAVNVLKSEISKAIQQFVEKIQ